MKHGMVRIIAVDHIGIRVTDAERSLAFYRQLGFEPTYYDDQDPVIVVRNDDGVELNFIVNANPKDEPVNVLMDVTEKHAGYTHVALRVGSIEDTVRALGVLGIRITDGPKRLGDGLSLFVRDPDRNVIELRQKLGP
jgi:lactoylglutathione lyase